MHLAPRFRLGLAAVVLVAFAGCKPPPENIKITERVYGPPDLTVGTKPNEANHSYQLRAFHLNHIWSDPARRENDHPYRAKLTLWDYAEDGSVVAEAYFDEDREPSPNPDPNQAKRPYHVHFPISTLGPILNTLRNTNEPVFLYYYEGAWSIGTYTAEPVGSD